MRLYGYFRSSASWRIRIVLGLKGIEAEQVSVHLLRGGGEQHGADFAALNPQELVPLLVTDSGQAIGQSIAIAEYLEETSPEPKLLPSNAGARAYVRGVMGAIACDIHPLNNLSVLRYLASPLGQAEPARDAWYRHWVERGLTAVERMVRHSGRAGAFCCADAPGLADAFLVPQLGNARRYACDLSSCPTLVAIDGRCAQMPAFQAARPEAQADAELPAA